ncbi:hypothetical protein [Bacillus thuringiensis]|uniref:hypothetical protein n=1 Tax=Bacillus thuringiensis TaxID=1428 RepID=UPI003A884242
MEGLPDKIIGLDQIRINRGIGKICKCENRKFVLDTTNKRVTCHSCGSVVDPYEAIVDLANQREEFNRQAELLLEQKKQLAAYKPHLRIIKSLEKSYRGRKMLPYCPRCSEPFYLEELTHWMGISYAERRIEKWKEQNQTK